MARKLKSDKVLFLATVLLVFFAGIVMVYSASAVMAMERFGSVHLFLIKQAMWVALGLRAVAMVMRSITELIASRRSSGRGSVVAVACSVLLQRPVNGARRWFGLGGIGVQPSELAKLARDRLHRRVLERRMHRVNDLRYALLPIAVVSAAWSC